MAPSDTLPCPAPFALSADATFEDFELPRFVDEEDGWTIALDSADLEEE